MPERFTRAQRSRIMAAIKSRDTQPELLVRRLIHAMGHRFRLHRRDLPGTPDIVLPGRRAIVNVHGCFWHLHTCPRGQRAPVRQAEYWAVKRRRNAERDRQTIARLRRAGWRVLTVWECQLRDLDRVARRLERFLSHSPLGRR